MLLLSCSFHIFPSGMTIEACKELKGITPTQPEPRLLTKEVGARVVQQSGKLCVA
jgi:hypothetical protein